MKIVPITPDEFKKQKLLKEDPEKQADIIIEALNKKLLLGNLTVKWPFHLGSELLDVVNTRLEDSGWAGISQEETNDHMFKLMVKEK